MLGKSEWEYLYKYFGDLAEIIAFDSALSKEKLSRYMNTLLKNGGYGASLLI